MKQDQLEMLFIGSILANPNGLATISIASGDLVTPQGIACYKAASDLFANKSHVNIQSLAMAAGFEKYVGWVSEAYDCGVSANLSKLAEEIKSRSAKKRIKYRISQIASSVDGSSVQESLNELRDIYKSELDSGGETGTIHEAMREFEEQSEKYRDSGNIGITTGFYKWDENLITYEPGHLWALGGFTSVGKTATALEFIGRIGKTKGLAIFSMEMTKPQIISRMLSRMTGYSSRYILSGKISDTALIRAKEYLSSQPIHIFRKTRNWGDIANACRVLKMQDQLDVAVWDYQQNIGADGDKTHDKMESIARGAQDLVQDLEITGVMLSQISLQQNRDDSGSPEFKGGGGLAECADIALHLSRPKRSQTELLVEMRKNRHGPKIDLLLEYQQHYTRLEEAG